MNKKEYLQQAFYLDKRINSKLEQIDSLNALATKATVTLSDMPKAQNKSTSKLEDILVKILSLEEEINDKIDELVDKKKNIMFIISRIKNKEIRIIFEERYLCYKKWEEIAVDMGYDIRQIYRLHNIGLKDIVI